MNLLELQLAFPTDVRVLLIGDDWFASPEHDGATNVVHYRALTFTMFCSHHIKPAPSDIFSTTLSALSDIFFTFFSPWPGVFFDRLKIGHLKVSSR